MRQRPDRGARGDSRQRRNSQAIEPFPSSVTPVKIAAYTARFGEMVLCDPTAGGFTITAPTAKGCAGQIFGIKEAGNSTNTITVDGHGSETINGAASATSSTAYACHWFMSDGTNLLTI